MGGWPPHRKGRLLRARAEEDRDEAGQAPVPLTDLLTRPSGSGETRRRTRDGHQVHVLVSEMGGHTPETWKTCVVGLIIQRSRVQILPPLPNSRSEASSDHGGGLLHAGCKRIYKRAPVHPASTACPSVPCCRVCTTRALSVARLLRSGCGSLRGGYLRALRNTELGQHRRDVVVHCLW
jgi:hypothetical protein